ncbi:MAG: hypothetical protein JRH11_04125 [Deltaproteobacteria bacterium]|nr:hypothetical protein [Deltaproteobacteria bacterium]
MPRFRRIIRPGDLVHVISRFVNEEFRLTCEVERGEYLRRIGERIRHSDWRLLSYALMSSHIHLTLIAGFESFEALFKSVHSPFSFWLNRLQGRLGPVFAGRPRTIIVEPIWTSRLIAYHHNNPPRARVVGTADESEWTSHQAYMAGTPCPTWLDTKLGLDLMGFGSTERGRQNFGRYVLDCTSAPRDPMLTGNLKAANRELREGLGVALSIEHPRSGPSGIDYAPRILAERWQGDLGEVVNRVARAMGETPATLSGSSRRRDLVSVRRVVVQVGRGLGQSNRAIGLRLGVSEGAVRNLGRNLRESEMEHATRFLAELASSASG